MANYAFKALDLSGASTNGEMDAGDKQAVAAQLRSKGLIVVDIEELVPKSAGDLLARWKKVKADDLVIATRQLSTMVNSGMSLLRSLYIIEEQTERTSSARSSSRSGRTSRPASRCPTRSRSTRTSSTTYTSQWSQAGETGGILD